MLTEIRVRDFAVLRAATLKLGPGLNVISGETGAGKSLAVDALGLLVGGRAASALVRQGAAKAVVEGVFDVTGMEDVAALLDELGLETEDGRLIVRREVRGGGRSRAWVSGAAATAGTLRRIGSLLVDIHGQHQHQRLLSTDFQRLVLDAFGGLAQQADEVAELHRRAESASKRLGNLEERQRDLESQADFARFRLNEIQAARVRSGEDEELRVEIRRLAAADKLRRGTFELQASLDDDDGSVTERLAAATERLGRLAEHDPVMARFATMLDDAYHRVTDIAADLRLHGLELEHDPSRLEELQARDALLRSLVRRHGPTLDDVIAKGEALAAELDELDSTRFDVDVLRSAAREARSEWARQAGFLSDSRRAVARHLESEVEDAFAGLGLKGGAFRVAFELLSRPAARGIESVRFVASMNPGFPPAPLTVIASGGELSRVMLALKSILAEVDELPVMVFDEIDAGVGGTVAQRVGERLEQVAEGRQVIAVTHLARIACRARRHFVVEKDTVAGRAETAIRRLDDVERVSEIARMLGGDPDSESSLAHARVLLRGG